MPATDGWRRYAVYWLPDGPLGDAGASWLGWDARMGRAVSAGDPAAAGPARYGFHATIRAPFRLADGVGRADMLAAIRTVAARWSPFDLGRLTVRRVGRHLALIPDRNPSALAAAVVRATDGLRRPPSVGELDRRRAAGLTPEQDALLIRWGYPHVMDRFDLHLTLAGPDPDAGAMDRAKAAFAAASGPHRIRALTLVGEDRDGRFHRIADVPLSGRPVPPADTTL
ncbi:DUF1045 domain-containing protein [Jannaschia sp. LMIT008]|uniref:DUF1045 domain-containing protein n=1 Tax=Jannaschia maritima TaxID=3032585 RepID=UPI0028109E20|nr:DUF1045 domain-containing protein [Jannaschia sp. LMIT008]